MDVSDLTEFYDVVQAQEISRKLDAIEAFILAQPVGKKDQMKRQQQLNKLATEYEMKLKYNRYEDDKEIIKARERGNAFIAEAKRLYEQSQQNKH
jgi:hypothetical protein